MIIHTKKENAPKIIEFDNPKEIGLFALWSDKERGTHQFLDLLILDYI